MNNKYLAGAIAALFCAACSGSDGTTYLVNVEDEAAGSNCAAGGSAIQTGPDNNGNGSLDEGEVTNTEYTCFDEPDPPDPTALTSLVEEPNGANCEFGGFAVNTGIDDSGDGVLDADEIDSTDYVCDDQSITDGYGTVIPTSITVTTFLELVLLSNFTEVQGDLAIAASALEGVETISLPNLAIVSGVFLLIDNGDATAIDLSGLTTVGDIFGVVNATAATSIDLSSLATVGGNMGFSNVGNAAVLSAGALTTITGVLAIGTGSNFGDIDMSALASVNDGGAVNDTGFVINGDSTVGNLNLMSLVTLGSDFLITGAATVVGNVDAPGALTVGDDIRVEGGATTGNLTFSGLVGADSVNVSGDSTVGDLALAGVLGGALTITGGATTVGDINAAGLTEVTGNLTITSDTVGAVDLSGLTTTSNFNVSNVDITSINLAALDTVANDFLFVNTTTVTDLTVPLLTVIGEDASDDLEVNNNAALTNISFALLESVDSDIEINGNTLLETVSFAALTEVVEDDLEVQNNPELTSLSMPMLVDVGTPGAGDNFEIENNAKLTTIDFSALAGVEGLFQISDNALLPCAQVEAVLAAVLVGSTPAAIDVDDNAADCNAAP